MPKNPENWQKIVNSEAENLQIFSNFHELFRKDVTYDNIKNHKKPGLYPLSVEDTFLEKRQFESHPQPFIDDSFVSI